ncbi:RHS repeat protein [Paenibacillus thiaminolyticus]|uniref:RHS repeat protein n=1 Tax=Paenibacillus thiaminolyticus TaxID=49283 RepID=A0A3A3H4K3_PANTH|nr:RHS repeat protein [Paenibacillus thiaminolyticus]RJG26623.1 RHS repeat protein [Paenibacillus thiaminolyticus]
MLEAIGLTDNEDKVAHAMYFYYNKNNVTVMSGPRRVTYNKGTIKVNGGEQEVLREVIDPQGRSTKYDYHVSPMVFNLVYGYRNNPPYDSWGKNDWIVLDLIEHPTKAMTKLNATRVMKKIGDYAVEEQLRYAGVEPTFNTPSETKKVNTLYVKHHKNEMQDIRRNQKFTTEVIEGMKQTIYSYDQEYVDDERPSITYLTQTDERILNTQERREARYGYDRSKSRTVPIHIEERTYNGRASSPVNVTKRSYNDFGLLLSETNPLGAVSHYQYDMVHFEPYYMALVGSDQPGAGGTRLKFEYVYRAGKLMQATVKDDAGQLLSQTGYTYDRHGNPIEIRIKGDQEDTVIKQEYSSRYSAVYPTKQTVEVRDVDGNTIPFAVEAEYDVFTGDITKYVDGKGQATVYTYDMLGRVLTETYPDGAQTKIEYDDAANIIRVTDPTGSVTEVHYDPIGRKVKEVNGRGEAKYFYDHRSRLIKKQDFNNSRIEYTYDDWGRTIQEEVITFHPIRTVYDDVNHTVTVIDGANNTLRTPTISSAG